MLPLCLNPTTVKRKQHNNTADKLLAKRIISAHTYLCCQSSRENWDLQADTRHDHSSSVLFSRWSVPVSQSSKDQSHSRNPNEKSVPPHNCHERSVSSSWKISPILRQSVTLSRRFNALLDHHGSSHPPVHQSMRQRRWALRAFFSRVRSLPRLKMWVLESTVSVLPSRLEACVTISTVFTAYAHTMHRVSGVYCQCDTLKIGLMLQLAPSSLHTDAGQRPTDTKQRHADTMWRHKKKQGKDTQTQYENKAKTLNMKAQSKDTLNMKAQRHKAETQRQKANVGGGRLVNATPVLTGWLQQHLYLLGASGDTCIYWVADMWM